MSKKHHCCKRRRRGRCSPRNVVINGGGFDFDSIGEDFCPQNLVVNGRGNRGSIAALLALLFFGL